MDETDESKLPPGRSPQRVGPTIPTSRQGPPLLEELAIGPAPQAPREEPPGEPPEPPQQQPLAGGPQQGEPFDWLAPLHNRLIIAGVSLLILLALTAVVLIVFSRGDGDPRTGPRFGIAGDDATTPTPASGLTAVALTTTTLRNGPDASFSPLGTVPRGARVPIIGRNADDSWLQVVYPPGSTIQGWIDVSFLEVTGDLLDVEIAGPGSGPSIIVPTSVPTFVLAEPTDTPAPVVEPKDEPTEEPIDTREATATPLETETPAPIETPVPTATQAPPATETPAVVPDEASPPTAKPQALTDRLTAPATLMRRPHLSMLPSGVTRQVTRRYRERTV